MPQCHIISRTVKFKTCFEIIRRRPRYAFPAEILGNDIMCCDMAYVYSDQILDIKAEIFTKRREDLRR